MKTIKSKRDFETVCARGQSRNASFRRIRVMRLDDGGPGRVAMAAAKRLGNAVFRNRCKRVLREAARLSGLPRDGFDVILLSTHRTHDSSPEQVAVALRRLLERAGA